MLVGDFLKCTLQSTEPELIRWAAHTLWNDGPAPQVGFLMRVTRISAASQLSPYHIHASDCEIGHVEDFLVDDAGWNIRYLTVDTRNWWPGERVLISPYSVRKIDWSGRLVHLSVNRQKAKDSPPYDPPIMIDGAYEEKFLTHYGIGWVVVA